MSTPPEPMKKEGLELPVVWVGVDEEPIYAVNQLIVQHDDRSFIITLGQLSPLALIGSKEEQIAQARELGRLLIRPVARVSMAPETVREFINALEANLRKFEERRKEQ